MGPSSHVVSLVTENPFLHGQGFRCLRRNRYRFQVQVSPLLALLLPMPPFADSQNSLPIALYFIRCDLQPGSLTTKEVSSRLTPTEVTGLSSCATAQMVQPAEQGTTDPCMLEGLDQKM